MAATIQIAQLTTYTVSPTAVPKIVISSLITFASAPTIDGTLYYRRSGAWINDDVVRRVRVNGTWVAL